MTSQDPISPALRKELTRVYEEIMWLAQREEVTPSHARGWYTHIIAERMKTKIRRFTGMVSEKAARNPEAELRLEHFLRIQTALTELVSRHKTFKRGRPLEFIRLVVEYEQVNVVTFDENYAAMRAKGDYKVAKIKLLSWSRLPRATKMILWPKMLNGRVCNADEYAVTRATRV